MSHIFKTLAVLIAYPWIAFVVAGALVALYRWVPRRLSLVTAGLWALYGLYEYGMKLRVLCSGECNIRVDLLLLYPALVFCSVIALGRVLMERRGSGKGKKGKGR